MPLPEPVYWSQQLFMIPYKWDSGSTATGASAVKLFLSQDRGQTWNEISAAKPEVQFFNYHAPSDGEYWFSMRTIDTSGKARPEGPHRPELRVIVDTQNPTVTTFTAQLAADGSVTAMWQASDPNINTQQAALQFRTPTDSAWRDVPSGSLRTPTEGFVQGDASWKVPAGTASVWVRLTVRDLAGNGREAGAEARMAASATSQLATSGNPLPPLPPIANNQPGTATAMPAGRQPAWTSNPAAAVNPYAMQAPSAFAATEAWPSDGESAVPFGSPGGTTPNQLTAPPSSSYASNAANPAGNSPNTLGGAAGLSSSAASTSLQANRPATRPQQPFTSPFQLPSSTSKLPNTHTASARPFGLEPPSLNRVPKLPTNSAPSPAPTLHPTPEASRHQSLPTLQPPPAIDAQPVQYLNSLDFEIGYDVDTAGTFGVTRVELWGTPDGGKSWKRLAVDTDNRSPILAAVPAPGDYGLKIVVETAGGIDPVRPRPGDQPEMRVRIDTTPPVARLTGISQGAGANADHLMVQWYPPASSFSSGETVSLAYSSHASGPWVNAAANLPNSGHYAWRLARHLPRRFYVRLEVHDQAGNVATDQTQVPVEINLPTPSGRLGNARPLQ